MLKSFLRLSLTLSLLFTCCVACTKSGGGGDSSSGSSNNNQGGGSAFRTDCGTVRNGGIQNPVASGNGIAVTISEAGTDGTVIIIRDGGRQLVKLRALSENLPTFQSSRAQGIVSSFPRNAILFTDDCPVLTQTDSLAIAGDLFSASGVSLTETLLTQSAAKVDGFGDCGESLVAGCYQALIDSTPVQTGGAVSYFLWKPQSERNGNLVVLLNPGNATIVVNGETLSSEGPSNGRGTTARANKSGAAFGTNVQVQVFDSLGRPLVFPNGDTVYIIPNGSQRVEF